MARTLKTKPPDPSLLGPEREPVLNLSISVVTPLFGGSAMPRETDPRNPVRAASVRGHLRFWWRACRGVTYASADDLFKAEEEIWGSTRHPGRLTVHVQTLDAGREVACATYQAGDRGLRLRWTNGYPGYALFPFQGELADGGRRVRVEPASGLEGVRFRVSIGLAGGVDDTARGATGRGRSRRMGMAHLRRHRGAHAARLR